MIQPHRVTSVREIQRNYRQIINTVKRTKRPVYVGARFEPEAVIVDVQMFENLQKQTRGGVGAWNDIREKLSWIRKGGKQTISLADFIHEDRQTH